MEEYPSNSKKSKQTKKVEKIVANEVIQREKSLTTKFKETFVSGDGRSVTQYVVFEVLIPAAKDTLTDVISLGLEKMLYGESRPSSRRGSSLGGRTTYAPGYISYNKYSTPKEDRRNISRRARSSHDFREIILQTRIEGEQVIDQMFDLISRYEQATVSDLYDLLGIETSYTDHKWGWQGSDLRGARVSKTRNGYLLDLPKPELLE